LGEVECHHETFVFAVGFLDLLLLIQDVVYLKAFRHLGIQPFEFFNSLLYLNTQPFSLNRGASSPNAQSHAVWSPLSFCLLQGTCSTNSTALIISLKIFQTSNQGKTFC
jgi:hypothetical protein